VNDSAVSIEIQSLRDEIESLRRGVNSDSPNSNSGDGDGYTPGDQEYDVLSGFSKNSVEKSGPGKRGGAPPPSMHVTGNDMLLAEDTNLPSWRENQQVQEELRSPKFIPAPAVNDGAPAFKMADACQAHVPTYNSMDVEELRELMQVRHLPVGMGDKPEMVAQLRDDDSKSPSVRASDRARRKREMRERSREPKPSARREAKYASNPSLAMRSQLWLALGLGQLKRGIRSRSPHSKHFDNFPHHPWKSSDPVL